MVRASIPSVDAWFHYEIQYFWDTLGGRRYHGVVSASGLRFDHRILGSAVEVQHIVQEVLVVMAINQLQCILDPDQPEVELFRCQS